MTELSAVLVDAKGTTAYLQMPLCRGGTLEHPTVAACSSLPDEMARWPVDLVRAMMHQLLSAVAHLHANDVVHSDIHPSNVMLDGGSGRRSAWMAVLGDFHVSLDLQTRNT